MYKSMLVTCYGNQVFIQVKKTSEEPQVGPYQIPCLRTMGSLQVFTHSFTTHAQVICSSKFLVHPVSLETSTSTLLPFQGFSSETCATSVPSRLWVQSVSPAG